MSRDTHPQVPRDHRGLLTRREPLAGLKPDPLTKRPTLSSQAPTLWIPHLTGIPQGSSTVTTRRQPENLSNADVLTWPNQFIESALSVARQILGSQP